MSSNPFLKLPVLQGKQLLLRPLLDSDFEALFRAASDPLIWEQHPDPLRWKKEVFDRNFFQGALRSNSTFVITDVETGSLIGSSRYYDWDAGQREVAIGYTFLVRECWGGSINAELKKLMLDHAFQWVQRIWFHVGENNLRSRKAMEKIGGQLIGLREDPIHGSGKIYAFYAIGKHQAK